MNSDLFILTPSGWLLAISCALIIGMSKAGLPGSGALAVPLMAMLFPPALSSGILLPVLICGDLFGVSYFNRHADWKMLARLLPMALTGVFIGFIIMKLLLHTDADKANNIIRISIALLVFSFALLRIFSKQLRLSEFNDLSDSNRLKVAIFFGLLAGITTQLANAAGPLMMIFLLSMKLPKESFIGTSAWFFCILNCCKVPFMIALGSINTYSLLFNLKLFPFVFIGAGAAIIISSKMSSRSFEMWIIILTLISAGMLLLK